MSTQPLDIGQQTPYIVDGKIAGTFQVKQCYHVKRHTGSSLLEAKYSFKINVGIKTSAAPGLTRPRGDETYTVDM
jgi:hypothetical protein